MNFNRNGFLFRCFTSRLFYDMFIKTNCYCGDCVDDALYHRTKLYGYMDCGEGEFDENVVKLNKFAEES
jgi:hypothetical protein